MQPLERLVNLVALLLESRRPLTFEEIRERMAGAYEQADLDSAKRMFERDKDILRDIDVPIEAVATDAWDVEQGYRISKDRYYLPDISFTPEEISALFVAASAGGPEASGAEHGVRKLLYGAEGVLGGVAGVPLAPEGGPTDARLTAAALALAERRRIRFGYRTARGQGSERRVDPYGLVFRGGHWYLVGLDMDREEIRAFRLSRLSSELADEGQAGAPPEGFSASAHVRAAPWGEQAPGEPPARARVLFDPQIAWLAARAVRGAEFAGTAPDGRAEVRVPVTDPSWVASWVLSHGPSAEVVEPAEVRQEVVRRLEAAVAGG
jgi:proteasome accessory factor B